MRHRLLVAAIVLFTAVACSPSSTYSQPRSSSSKRYRGGHSARMWTAPAAICAGAAAPASQGQREPLASPTSPGDAWETDWSLPPSPKLAIRVDGEGRATLHVEGAPLWAVLEELAEGAGGAVLVRGVGADALVYASVKGAPWREVVAKLARSVGMKTRGAEGPLIEVLDPRLYLEATRSRPRPQEQTLLRARRPTEVADIASELMLGCGQKIITVTSEDKLLVQADGETTERIARLIDALEGEAPSKLTLETPAARSRALREAAIQPACGPTPAHERRGGPAIGQRVVAQARAMESPVDIIIGCGGAAPSRARLSGEVTPAQLAIAAGLTPLAPNVFVRDEMWRAPREAQPRRVVALSSASPTTMAQIAAMQLPGLRARPYLASGVLVVEGEAEEIEALRRLITAWEREE